MGIAETSLAPLVYVISAQSFRDMNTRIVYTRMHTATHTYTHTHSHTQKLHVGLFIQLRCMDTSIITTKDMVINNYYL
jgi:hypothetical protein